MRRARGLVVLVLALCAGAALAARPLAVYCSQDADACELAAQTFERDTGVNTSIIRKPTGEYYAQIRAERENPRADVWYGGTIEPFLQAAAGLFTAYPMRRRLKSILRASARPRSASGCLHAGSARSATR